MNKQTNQLKHQQEVDAQFTLDLKRSVVMMKIAVFHMEAVMNWGGKLPKYAHPEITKPLMDSMDKYIHSVQHAHPKDKGLYLDKALGRDKLMDVANIIDLMLRINTEEEQDIYEEFLGLLVDCIDEVFYSQKHRGRLQFGKYKALFKLITDEMRIDVNRVGGNDTSRVKYLGKGDLSFRLASPIFNDKTKMR